jgi:hypothetical protein
MRASRLVTANVSQNKEKGIIDSLLFARESCGDLALATCPLVKVPFVSWNSFLKTGFPAEVEFECQFQSAHFGFLRLRCLCHLGLSRFACSGSFRFCSHRPTLKMGFSGEVESECPFRNARSGFLRQIVPMPAQNS